MQFIINQWLQREIRNLQTKLEWANKVIAEQQGLIQSQNEIIAIFNQYRSVAENRMSTLERLTNKQDELIEELQWEIERKELIISLLKMP